MSRERLEKIKESLVKLHNAIDIDDETKDYIFNDLRIEWLIERVQELEETNKKNYWIASDFKYENLVLEQQNKRYREALEQIANSDGWLIEPNPLCTVDEAYGRCVEKARQSLEVNENE